MMLTVLPEHEGARLDRWLADCQSDLSRSYIQTLIAQHQVRVNGREVRGSYKVVAGDAVALVVPPPEPLSIHPEDIPLDVFFEDEHLLVVCKPVGMAVHPAGKLRSGTLVNALLFHCEQLSGIHGMLRPGIVHRLDKDTSGLMVVAKSDAAHRGLAEQLEARAVVRRYAALVWGCLDADEGRIEAPIDRHGADRMRMAVREDGRFAATRWAAVRRYDFLTRLLLRLETGRTHQIRVHLSHIHHPVFGDPVYGGGAVRINGISPMYRPFARQLLKGVNRQMLHAVELGFTHPVTGEALHFEADVPEDMRRVFQLLEGEG